MTELKSADEWLETETKDVPSIKELIQLVQRNAIEAALEIAAENAKTITEYFRGIDYEAIDKESITSLKHHEKLKV